LIDLNFEDRLFESYVMKFAVPLTSPQATELKEDSMLEYNGEQFFITDVYKSRNEDGQLILRVEAESSWMRLTDRKRPGTFSLSGVNARVGLERIISGMGWTVGECTTSTAPYAMSLTDATVLQLIWEWAKITGNEIRFDPSAKTVQMIPTIGVQLPVSFRYESNLQSIERHAQPPQVTKLYPYGKDNLSIASANSGVPYLEDFTYYTLQGFTEAQARALYTKEDIYYDEGITDAITLYNRASLLMDALSVPSVVYTAKVVDIPGLWDTDLADYKVGDTVHIYDELIGVDERARISRLVRWPDDPANNEIELSFNAVVPPDTTSTTSRSDPNQNWELFTSRNDNTNRQIRLGDTVLARLKLSTSEGAEWIVGYNLKGVGVGTGTITIDAVDDETTLPIWDSETFSVSNGVPFQYSFSYGKKEIPSGTYTLVVRANSNSSTTGLDIAPGDSSMWVLARSTTKLTISLEESIRFEPISGGAFIQYFTVPDDISQIQIEAVGAGGGGGGFQSSGGRGGQVSAKFPVIAGTTYSVWVGTAGNDSEPGWPNGGFGENSSNQSPGGGGSSSVQPYVTYTTNPNAQLNAFLGSLSGALIVAGGGGGGGDNFFTTPNGGGDAGFYTGGKNEDLHGTVATQFVGGSLVGTAPFDGSFGLGGTGTNVGAVLRASCGGGGGGWYGGYATTSTGAGTYEGEGGGGGSGWVHPSAFDLEFDNGQNSEDGYILISWKYE
jgi:phage minor structural protein